jgi:hypothetical protein|tara:strand:- start:78 stop:896 length:819 start_codon:yes stop_codon:yes gene_type:complete
MATLNELIAQLNASSDNILSNANSLNTTANNMNQTLDGMGVNEISGIQGILPDAKDTYQENMYTGQLPDSFSNNLTQDTTALVPQNLEPNITNQKNDGIMSQIKDYFKGGGSLGAAARFIGEFIPDMDPRQVALRNYYGYDNIGRVPQGQLMAGYNPVSGGLLNMLSGGKYGQPTNYGLQNAYQKRIDTINRTLARKYADGDYSGTLLDERLKALQDAKIQESMMLDQVNQNTAFENYQNDPGSYSGGETTTNVGGQNITSYNDPFDPGGGE